MKLLGILCAATILAAPLNARADDAPHGSAQLPTTPLRHLVYTYSVSERGDTEYHYGGIGTGSPGVGTSFGGGTDKGTIIADVMAMASDGGLIIRISEKSSQDRSRFVDPVMCAVYSNTNVTCAGTSQDRPIEAEMYALLRVLGRRFYDASNLDAHNHWQFVTGGSKGLKETTDYTVTSSDSTLARITESIVVRDQDRAQDAQHVDGNIVYDIPMSVPRSLHEDMISHPSAMSTFERSVDLQLQTDSFAKTKNTP